MEDKEQRRQPVKSDSFFRGIEQPSSDQYIIDRVRNTVNRDIAATPPKQQLGQRTLNVTDLQLIRVQNGEGVTRFTLSWKYGTFLGLYTPVFRVYANLGLTFLWQTGDETTDNTSDVFELFKYSDNPPCHVDIYGYDRRRVVFKVQAQQLNGFSSDFETAPTVSGIADPLEGRVKSVSTTYTALPGDRTIIADTTSAGFTITLKNTQTLPEGYTYTIKKSYADVSGNTLTVAGSNSGQTIDGAATSTWTTAGQVRRFRRYGSVWEIV